MRQYKDPEKKREYQRKWMVARRQKWVEDHGPCAVCGSADRLEVDHKDPRQKVTHRVWSWRKDKQAEELAKCQVLCFECHKNKSNKAAAVPIAHGTSVGYNRKCRCRPCTAAWAGYRRDQRALKGRQEG